MVKGDMMNRAIPRILVRIDRGEDWVELCGDLGDGLPPICGQGNIKDWVDYQALGDAWHTANDAVME